MRVLAPKVAAIAVGVTLILGGPARAVPIEYIFTSSGTGSLGTTALSNVLFELKITGDTGSVSTGSFPDPYTNQGTPGQGNFYSNIGTATFSSGLLNAALPGSRVLLFNDNQGFDFPPRPQVLFVQGTSFAGLASSGVPPTVFGSYDLTTAFSLISTSSPTMNGSISGTPVTFLTDQGELSLDITGSLTFEARLGTVPVPLHPSIIAQITGLGLMGPLAWRRKRKATAAIAAT